MTQSTDDLIRDLRLNVDAANERIRDLERENATLRATPPIITAMFETRSGSLIGSTLAKILRVDCQDDGSYTVVINHWPRST